MNTLIELIEKYYDKKRYNIREYNGRVSLGVPRSLPYHDEGVAVGIRYVGDGEFVLDDAHTISDYYELFDMDIANFQSKFDELTKKYSIKFDGTIMWKSVEIVEEVDLKEAIDTFVDELFTFAKIQN